MISKEDEAANYLNHFLSNILKNLEIPAYNVDNTFYLRFSDRPALQAFFSFFFNSLFKFDLKIYLESTTAVCKIY